MAHSHTSVFPFTRHFSLCFTSILPMSSGDLRSLIITVDWTLAHSGSTHMAKMLCGAISRNARLSPQMEDLRVNRTVASEQKGSA